VHLVTLSIRADMALFNFLL